MDETILLPSPNWFLVSNIAVGTDGWVIYGGPSKSLCVLEPLETDIGVIEGNDKYRAHVVTRAHPEKIVSLDMSPEWLEKRNFITGSSGGLVKQWIVETLKNKKRIKATHSHEVHQSNKEDIAGVGYSNETTAITVGTYGNIVKWDLTSNLAKTYSYMMKNFKPTCMACSKHVPLNVAIGTKQGVVFVMDLTGNGKIIYKVRGQDDEVMNVSWCPKYETPINKTLKESENRSFLAKRLEDIRNEGQRESVLEQSGVGKNLPEDSFDESIVEEDDMFDIYKDHEPDEFGHKKYVPEEVLVKVKQETAKGDDYLAECLKLRDDILKRKNQTEPSIESLVQALDDTHVEGASEVDTVEVPETVQAKEIDSEASTSSGSNKDKGAKGPVECSPHNHRHLLATVGKYGGVRIWSKSGKLVATCAVPTNAKNIKNKVSNWPTLLWYKPNSLLVVDGKSQLLEMNPLQIDCKNKLEWKLVHALHKRGMYCIASNAPPVFTDDTATNDAWSVWSFSQDRNIIRYCMKTRKVVGVHATCGGFVYSVTPCPYDAGKVAVSVGDGAVRVCDFPATEPRLAAARVASYWQHVQGKVLSLAWHPTAEHLLAFATAESRVGLIDTSKADKPARPLQSALNDGVYSLCWGDGLNLYANGGGNLIMYKADKPDQAPTPIHVELEGNTWKVYAVSTCPHGLLVGSFVGGVALLTPTPPHQMITATYVFTKMIHAIEWHPQQTSSSSEESPYKDLIAVTSLDKENAVAILEFGTKEDGSKQLTKLKTLVGHKLPVFQVVWNPHRDEQLLSTSQDSTVRVWDVTLGTCISIFGGHSQSSLGAAWLPQPHMSHHIMSGGGDACLRLWDIYQHKAENYDETRHEVLLKKKDKKVPVKKEKGKEEPEPTISAENEDLVAKSYERGHERVVSKVLKKFMLPVMFKQMNDPCQLPAPRKMLQMYLEKTEKAIKNENGSKNVTVDENSNTNTIDEKGDHIKIEGEANSDKVNENGDVTENNTNEIGSPKKDEIDLDFLKVFGSIKEVNEFLDLEMENHMTVGCLESWMMLSIFRGHIDTMIQFASQKDMLDPFLLSMAPCVSFKYWKDATQLYLAQIDRLVAMKEEEKLYDIRCYGGPVYRKVAVLLSIHDVKGAVATLVEAKLFKEAYILCRLRYMESVAESILREWAADLAMSGRITVAAICYIVLKDLSEAAQVLSRSSSQEVLSLAADIAKIAGRNSFADHVEQKKALKSKEKPDKTEEILKELPSKIELLMKENKIENGDQLNELNNGTLSDHLVGNGFKLDGTENKE